MHILSIIKQIQLTGRLRIVETNVGESKWNTVFASRHRYYLMSIIAEVRQVAGRLQNGVGDLKAEWLLIKRDVQELKSQNMQLKFNHDDMQEDAIKLKQRIEDIWGEMQKVMVSRKLTSNQSNKS